MEDVLPVDKLISVHEHNNCWCYPVELGSSLIHRHIALIDRMGREGEYITGYVHVKGLQLEMLEKV